MDAITLSILDLSTLGRMKNDALGVCKDYGQSIDRVIAARRLIIAIDLELDARMQWVDDVREALAAL